LRLFEIEVTPEFEEKKMTPNQQAPEKLPAEVIGLERG
jgi:hypothetical protein